MASNTLVFDMRNPCGGGGADALGQWYEWELAGSAPVAACVHGGVFHWLDVDGTVHYEVPGQFHDGSSTPILPAVEWAPLSYGRLGGAERIYRMQVDGRAAGDATITLTTRTVEDDRSNPVAWTEDKPVTAGDDAIEARPSPQRGTSIAPRVEEKATVNLTQGYKVRALEFEVGINGRMRRLGVGQRVAG